jgi:glutaredoxin-related protein
MTTREILEPARIDPAALNAMNQRHAETIREVRRAIEKNAVVVVGMAQNPHVKKARRALTEAKIAFEYLEYGSYFSEWRRRLAIKMWSGWPTFPQVFVRGVLIGGNTETRAALADGTFRTRLEGPVGVAN